MTDSEKMANHRSRTLEVLDGDRRNALGWAVEKDNGDRDRKLVDLGGRFVLGGLQTRDTVATETSAAARRP